MLFLSCRESNMITGEDLVADGGFTIYQTFTEPGSKIIYEVFPAPALFFSILSVIILVQT